MALTNRKYVKSKQTKVTIVTLVLPANIAEGVAECINTYADGGVDAREPEIRAAVEEVAREIRETLGD